MCNYIDYFLWLRVLSVTGKQNKMDSKEEKMKYLFTVVNDDRVIGESKIEGLLRGRGGDQRRRFRNDGFQIKGQKTIPNSV